MIKKIFFISLFTVFYNFAYTQIVKTPDEIYKELFVDVQVQQIFPDGKTFVDCIPKRNPEAILSDYLKIKNNPAIKFSLKDFVLANFDLPINPTSTYRSDANQDVKEHIKQLWSVLNRNPDKIIEGSSLLSLPNPYIVPGGRFREIYYWDSYFTMLGLKESNEVATMENMVKNFAYLIDQYGHIPNGNRSYYLSRSQPPFFSLMVGLLADVKGTQVYEEFLPSLEKEYNYWIKANIDNLLSVGADNGVVKINQYLVNRYWDERVTPRQESYREDVETAEKSLSNKELTYKNLRSGAASGWDFSSRWFADGKSINTIQTTSIIPVDLNSLLYHLEMMISKTYLAKADIEKAKDYARKAKNRKAFIDKYCWNKADGFYYDYNFKTGQQEKIPTLAALYPLFFNLSKSKQAEKVALKVKSNFLQLGGVTTTLNRTGQQWDAPNGWAPLQWITIQGLENYKQNELAKEIANRWIKVNVEVFKRTGKLMEKYNVMDTNLEAGGGEYPSQDGFGWTNGVLLKLMNTYQK